jgi:hypothetical protein
MVLVAKAHAKSEASADETPWPALARDERSSS